MLTQHIALVTAAGGVNLSDLARVSAALQKQVSNDLGPLWGVTATVDGFPQLEDVPTGYWPIIVGLPDLGLEAGVHLDENGQPYALVELTSSWSFEASRACLEMLVNPFGDRTVTGPSPRADQGTAQFVVEVCSPNGEPTHAYPVNGILVADFCTPAYYGAAASARDRPTFRDALSAPFELARGGRLVWRDAITNKWWLRTRPQDEPVDSDLGLAEHGRASVRELVRAREPRGMRDAGHARQLLEDRTRLLEHQESVASRARAFRLRALLAKRLLRGPERAPVLLTEQRVRTMSGPAPVGVSPQERVELTMEEVASWVDGDAPGAAEVPEAHPGPSHEAASDSAPHSAAKASFPSATSMQPETPDVALASAATSGAAQPAPAQFPSIAPFVTTALPANGRVERRAGWLFGGALAAAALFLAFGLGSRFEAGPDVPAQDSPALAPAAVATPPAHATPPIRPEPPSVAAEAPLVAAQPSAPAATPVPRLPSVAAEGRVEIANTEEQPRRRRRSTSDDSAAERVGARHNARTIEELIETRR